MDKKERPMQNPRAVILTALQVEFNAVRAHLTEIREEVHKGTVYERGIFSGNGRTWEVGIVEVGAGNDGAAFEAERAITRFEPSVAFFVGIAGGVKDVKVGDVVAATKVYGYESGRAEQTFKPRPDVGNSSYPMVQRARAEARRDDWKNRIIGENTDFSPNAFVGPIAAGQKVIAATESDLYEFLKNHYNDTLAVEMEGRGFLEAAHANQQVIALIVRGISDLISNKSDLDDALRQGIAARHASAFAFEVLAKLDGVQSIDVVSAEIMVATVAATPATLVEPTAKGLATESSTIVRPAGPPPTPEIFLGRDEDMAELKKRLGILREGPGSGSVQVLTAVRGWPGIGKTATATVLASDSEMAASFPDGVLWTSLGHSGNLLSELATWGRALGTDEILRAPTLKEATALLAALLRNRKMLLIVDDVWEVEQVVPFQQARGSDCALLITTRQPGVVTGLSLSDDAVYNLPALTEDRALELLRVLAPTVVAEHDAECTELVRDIECLPLALHVAGRMLNAESKIGWGVTELLKELRAGAKLIEAKAPADMMDYETQTIPTVAALLKKSTDRLDDFTRDCFAYLGPFAPKPATFDLDAMKDVWEVDDPRPIARILVERGLLEPVGGRFQMHALLVAHAHSLLSDE
jgi:nucleoside phosphorylase